MEPGALGRPDAGSGPEHFTVCRVTDRGVKELGTTKEPVWKKCVKVNCVKNPKATLEIKTLWRVSMCSGKLGKEV